MMTDKDYWDREQFYDAVCSELKQRNLVFDSNALFDLVIDRWPSGKSAAAVADELVAAFSDRFTTLQSPTMFYVATLARYVLVEADNEEQARERGQTALEVLYAELRLRQGAEMPVVIRTIRPATTDEIDFCRWNEETLAREGLRWHE
jgi:hypothetical protein